MTNKSYDLIIIGGGPIGIACALEAQKSHLDFLIIEKGCIVNSLYNYPLNMTFFSTSEKLEIGIFNSIRLYERIEPIFNRLGSSRVKVADPAGGDK